MRPVAAARAWAVAIASAASRTERYPEGRALIDTGTGPVPDERRASSASRYSCEPTWGRWAGAVSGVLHR